MSDLGSLTNFKNSINPGGANEIYTNGNNEITGLKANTAFNDLADTTDAQKADKQAVTAGYIGPTTESSGDAITIPFIQVASDGVIVDYGTRTHTVPLSTLEAYLFNTNSISGSLTAIPVTRRIVIATVSADQPTVALANTLAEGHEIHVIVHNTSSSPITITLPSSSPYVPTGDTLLTIAGYEYGEINFLKSGSIYVRSSAGGAPDLSSYQQEVTVESTIPNTGMVANVMYSLGTLTANKTVTLAADTSGYYRQYMLDCACGATAYQITFPNTVKWQGGSAPTFEANKSYQVIIDTLGKGVFMEF